MNEESEKENSNRAFHSYLTRWLPRTGNKFLINKKNCHLK